MRSGKSISLVGLHVCTVQDPDDPHATLAVRSTGDDGTLLAPVDCCGEPRCPGSCGLPAAVLSTPDGYELRLLPATSDPSPLVKSHMVAWRGARIFVPSRLAEVVAAVMWL